MMNLKAGATQEKSIRNAGGISSRRMSRQTCERGYTLVALLAVMTIILLVITAAAPSIRHQAQRERETEAIFRGEQVAEAIRLYVKARNALPNSMEQLLEGIPSGTKKRQILRPSAARDPLSSSGEWRLVQPMDRTMIDFTRAVQLYAGGRPLTTSDQSLQIFAQRVASFGNVLNTGTKEAAPGGEDDSASSSVPFIGVSSRSRRNSIIHYYDIDRHDQWVFTPLFK